MGSLYGIAALKSAADRELPPIRRARAGQHVHERRLAGAIVADEPDAFPGPDKKVHAVECADGAEMSFDAVQLDDIVFAHGRYLVLISPSCPAGSPASYLILALIAASASSWVYSWLATPPFSIVGSTFSKSSCVKAR